MGRWIAYEEEHTGMLAKLDGCEARILLFGAFPYPQLLVGFKSRGGCEKWLLRVEMCSRICAPVSWVVEHFVGKPSLDDGVCLIDCGGAVCFEGGFAAVLTYDGAMRFAENDESLKYCLERL